MRIANRDDEAILAVPHLTAAVGSRHHRYTASECLEVNDREAIGQRRKDENVGLGELCPDDVPRHLTHVGWAPKFGSRNHRGIVGTDDSHVAADTPALEKACGVGKVV